MGKISEINNLLDNYEKCHTIKMGGRIVECPACKEKMVLYNPCNKRGCPECGEKNQQQWREKVNNRLLDMGHLHLVIVPPEMYSMIWLYHKIDFINSLFYSNKRQF